MAKFVCACCGRTLPLNRISQETLYLANTTQPAKAITVLDPDDVMCGSCDNLASDHLDDPTFSRNAVEAFEFSGTYVSPGMQVFYQNNY
jgi:hypothetical protein